MFFWQIQTLLHFLVLAFAAFTCLVEFSSSEKEQQQKILSGDVISCAYEAQSMFSQFLCYLAYYTNVFLSGLGIEANEHS